jgi:hypothetical protein
MTIAVTHRQCLQLALICPRYHECEYSYSVG